MKVLIAGVCGFVGSAIASTLHQRVHGIEIIGLDNLSRPGSELNRRALRAKGFDIRHADLRNASDLENLPAADWVIDAAANPSVLAGLDGRSSSRQLAEHNLFGTINLLEYCRAHTAGFILLSTSRVYSIAGLSSLPVDVVGGAFVLSAERTLPAGVSPLGVDEQFSTAPPLSLYGSSKLASEILALEYGEAFGFPVWVNRCGVLAGAGQFGRVDQGIFAFWINTWLRGGDLNYLGFGGTGHQVRDCLHPSDLTALLLRQIEQPHAQVPRILNVSGGTANTMSLRQLSEWCEARFGPRQVGTPGTSRIFDIPWMVLDPSSAKRSFDWSVQTPIADILGEIADHAEAHPEWLSLSAQ